MSSIRIKDNLINLDYYTSVSISQNYNTSGAIPNSYILVINLRSQDTVNIQGSYDEVSKYFKQIESAVI